MKYRFNGIPNKVIGVINRMYPYTRSDVWTSYYDATMPPRTIYKWMEFLDDSIMGKNPMTDADKLILMPYVLGEE